MMREGGSLEQWDVQATRDQRDIVPQNNTTDNVQPCTVVDNRSHSLYKRPSSCSSLSPFYSPGRAGARPINPYTQRSMCC